MFMQSIVPAENVRDRSFYRDEIMHEAADNRPRHAAAPLDGPGKVRSKR